MPTITLYSSEITGQYVLLSIYEYLKKYDTYYNKDAIYISSKRIINNEYPYKKNIIIEHILSPVNGDYIINDIKISIKDLVINDKIQIVNYSDKSYIIIKEINIFNNDDDKVKEFITNCYNNRIKNIKSSGTSSNNKLNKKIYSEYGWIHTSYISKRNLDTIFLKKGQIDKIKNRLEDFLSEKTYLDYIKHGIPYKFNILLHGPPGVGKTCLIHAIATLYNADICVLNINAELKESELLKAFKNINEEDKICFIIIEDIDCIFEDRKNNDGLKNQITMQGFLNAMDGFNNQEGLILILTTNYPEILDNAILRSGRIDLNIELTYCDKYQAYNMYKSFFGEDETNFNKLWENIKSFDIAPCMLLDFLFFNRKNKDNINDKIKDLVERLQHKANNIYN